MGDRDWLRLRAALDYCAAQGKPFSKPGLYVTAERHGFSRRDVEGTWWFSRKGIDDYLAVSFANPGPDWVRVPVAAKELDVSEPIIYVWIRKGLVKSKRGGHTGRWHYVRIGDMAALAARVYQKRDNGKRKRESKKPTKVRNRR